MEGIFVDSFPKLVMIIEDSSKLINNNIQCECGHLYVWIFLGLMDNECLLFPSRNHVAIVGSTFREANWNEYTVGPSVKPLMSVFSA